MQLAATVIEQLFHRNYILSSISARYENGSYILCPFLRLILSFINSMFVWFVFHAECEQHFWVFLASDHYFQALSFLSPKGRACLSVCLNIYVNLSFKAPTVRTPYLCPDDTAPSACSKSALLYLLWQ